MKLSNRPMSAMKLLKRQHAAFNQKPSYRASAGDWLHHGGHVYHQAVYRFLCELGDYRAELAASSACQTVPANWLMPFREDFRRAIRHENPSAIREYLATCRPEMSPIGVWLISKCANRFRLYDLKAFRNDPSPPVRRHVAKALRRLEAWALLREMAEANLEDAKIQWFAAAPTMRRPFVDRLKDFTSSIDDSHAGEVFTPSRMPFWALERVWVWERTPPKSVALIRRMLRRIRHWVRWGLS